MRHKSLHTFLIFALTVNSSLVAAESSSPSTVVDLVASETGLVELKLVNRSGNTVRDSAVSFMRGRVEVATAVANHQGKLSVAIEPGMYTIATRNSVALCRVWKAGTAPVGAIDELQLVTGRGVARGQLVAPSFWYYAIPVGLIAGGVIGYRVSQKTAS